MKITFTRLIAKSLFAHIWWGACVTLAAAHNALGVLGRPCFGLGVDGVLTLLDIAKATGSDAVVGLIEENQSQYPEFTRFPARTIKGTNFKTLHRLDYPTIGFRGANEGTTLQKSSYANKLTECFIIDAQIRVDKAVAEASEDGPESVKAREASGVMLGTMRGVAQQIYYGVANNAKGFPGLAATVDAAHTLDLTGTTKSSAYAIKFGNQDVTLVGGQGKSLELAPAWWVQQVPQSDDATKFYTAFCNALCGWLGLQLANSSAFGRIKALGADGDTGKTMSDTQADNLLLKMPANWVPDLWIMNRRSLNQLRASRVTALQPRVPIPTEINGVPIMATDAITSAETI